MGEKLFTTDISGGLRSRETLADHLDLPLKEEGCGDHGSKQCPLVSNSMSCLQEGFAYDIIALNRRNRTASAGRLFPQGIF